MKKRILLTMTSQEDVYCYLLTQELYDKWPDNMDAMSWLNKCNNYENVEDKLNLLQICKEIEVGRLSIVGHVEGISY